MNPRPQNIIPDRYTLEIDIKEIKRAFTLNFTNHDSQDYSYAPVAPVNMPSVKVSNVVAVAPLVGAT